MAVLFFCAMKCYNFGASMTKLDPVFKKQLLGWANSFEVCCMLDSNAYSDTNSKYDLLVAAGACKQLTATGHQAFEELKHFYRASPGWLFGLLAYDLKNGTEALSSQNADLMGFPDLFFFAPEYLIGVKQGHIEVLIGDPALPAQISTFNTPTGDTGPIDLKPRMSRETYLEKVRALKEHIRLGDIYEVTFCQEFFAEHAVIDPVSVYQDLSTLSPTPFAGFFKIKDRYVLSASPERFLSKRNNHLLSQPIKGTAKRSTDPAEDENIRRQLRNDKKEQAENVMIVDLVRNDLTKSAVPGTVKVKELFGIYSFPQVHQMISSISCELNPELDLIDAIKNTFPMGSMTGAPKIRAMELIERYEESKRGAYSGALGYIDPAGDFDFNVVIRSILYHQSGQRLSFQVGGAITYASDPQKEYEECLLKASAMIKTLKGLNEQPF